MLMPIILLVSNGLTQVEKEIALEKPTTLGVNPEKLYLMSDWVKNDQTLPIFSILLSKDGKIVYELYTGTITKDSSHYMMSVTKSILSLITGCAVDENFIKPDEPLSNVIPEKLFIETGVPKEKYNTLTLKEAMAMSAYECPHDPPGGFFTAPNRLKYVLATKLVEKPGESFCYNNQTPILVTGSLSYITGKTVYEIGREKIFSKMQFKNEEWMHQDKAGIECGGWGFRMRPIDMQKVGIMVLNNGEWDRKRILSKEWIDMTARPIIKSNPGLKENNYGWFWWTKRTSDGSSWQVAGGRWGQRIAINRKYGAVLSMTACFMNTNEEKIFDNILETYVVPALTDDKLNASESAYDNRLVEINRNINQQRFRGPANIQQRMIPVEQRRETHHDLLDSYAGIKEAQ
jgi:CubicO group peptidase (beta-lactamase class C family)